MLTPLPMERGLKLLESVALFPSSLGLTLLSKGRYLTEARNPDLWRQTKKIKTSTLRRLTSDL